MRAPLTPDWDGPVTKWFSVEGPEELKAEVEARPSTCFRAVCAFDGRPTRYYDHFVEDEIAAIRAAYPLASQVWLATPGGAFAGWFAK